MKAMIAGVAERRILLDVPVLFFAGTLFHFGFRLSGELFFVGLLAPVNESVWEHFKLLLWPVPLVLLIALAVLFAVFTLAPPPLPLFTDPNTGQRGIFQIG